jgi:dolichol-phosphate mannosyltransferase
VTAAAPELTIAILARNEAANLPPLVARVREAMRAVPVPYEILVVEGRSTDGTPEVARGLGCRVTVQERPGHGEALRHAFAQPGGEYLVLMDADHSHPPEALPELLARRHDADLVLASRYVDGGASADAPARRLASRALNAAYRLATGLPFRDLSSGYRVYRRPALAATPLRARHIDLQEEIVFRFHRAGRRVIEVPYRFAPRREGRSNARWGPLAAHFAGTLLRLLGERLRLVRPA